MTWRAVSARPYPEILMDFAGKRLDYFVTGYGTGRARQSSTRMLNPPLYNHMASYDVASSICLAHCLPRYLMHSEPSYLKYGIL